MALRLKSISKINAKSAINENITIEAALNLSHLAQEAVDFLEKNKVYVDTLQTDMVPLSVAYKALELSVNTQLEDTLNSITVQMEGILGDLNNLAQEND